MKITISLLITLLFTGFIFGQMKEYSYKSELQNVSDIWHTIELPNSIFGKLKNDLSDIRIFGITKDNDTIEAPYLLETKAETIHSNQIPFKIINTSHSNKSYFYTFLNIDEISINQIKLDFNVPNFDWKVTLEGSNNQTEWFTILDEYRVLSIKNKQTDYQFTTLNFPESIYKYFRIKIKSKQEPKLNTASLKAKNIEKAVFNNFKLESFQTKNNKVSNETVLDITLKEKVPVCYLQLNIEENFDYYRPISISYLVDSIKTEVGYRHNYRPLFNGTLSSLEKNKFRIPSTILQKLKVKITNHDNEPLSFSNPSVKGYQHQIIARFTTPAIYYLCYGNKTARIPKYDLSHFEDQIPENIKSLQVKKEQIIQKENPTIPSPLFENKAWLWAVMGVIMLVLGVFSLKMIKK